MTATHHRAYIVKHFTIYGGSTCTPERFTAHSMTPMQLRWNRESAAIDDREINVLRNS